MIKIVENNKKEEFLAIEEFYKWLIHDKNYSKELEIDDIDANDLYNFIKFYVDIKGICSDNLDKVNKKFINSLDNSLVTEAIEELIRMNSEGKFLRASLIALGYKTFSKDNDDAYLSLASAYETFQTAILIHDDIIDNASLRRGKFTIPESYNKRFDSYNLKEKDFEKKKNHISKSLGLCIGDLGFYLASKIIIENYCQNESFNKILNLYNKIVINTIKGEIIDVLLPFNEQYQGKNKTTLEDIMEIYKLKTAWYSIIGPYSLGMALADEKEENISKMENILYNLGIAFQIKDDILGIFGDEKELGKSASSDISEFKQTILYAYLVKTKPELLEKLNKYYGKENLSCDELNIVKDLFVNSGAYDYSLELMRKLFEKSKQELSEIDFIDTKYKSILYGFIQYLSFRTK